MSPSTAFRICISHPRKHSLVLTSTQSRTRHPQNNISDQQRHTRLPRNCIEELKRSKPKQNIRRHIVSPAKLSHHTPASHPPALLPSHHRPLQNSIRSRQSPNPPHRTPILTPKPCKHHHHLPQPHLRIALLHRPRHPLHPTSPGQLIEYRLYQQPPRAELVIQSLPRRPGPPGNLLHLQLRRNTLPQQLPRRLKAPPPSHIRHLLPLRHKFPS
jgi:hypothetical protein